MNASVVASPNSTLRTYLSPRFVRLHWPAVSLAFFMMGRHLIAFLIGIHPSFASYFPIGILFWLLGFVLSVICLVTTVIRILRRQPFLRFSLAWVFLAALNLIPGIIPSAAGAVTSLLFAGPEQVVEEGRELLNTYQSSDDLDCDVAIPPCGQTTDYPPAIRRLNPVYVRVTRDYVLIKKFGFGDIAGFLIYPSGVTPGGMRLIDGLYWIDSW